MDRRQFVLSVGIGAIVMTAGCTGDTEEQEEQNGDGDEDEEPEEPTEEDQENQEDETEESEEPEEVDNEELAQQAANVIDDELGLDPTGDDNQGWEFGEQGGEWFVEYVASGDQRFDLQVAGGAYAGIVDQGFEPNAVLMGNEEGMGGGYIADIERDWAAEFMSDNISEDEYLEMIEETI